jgi:hypothetical protein
MGGGPATAKTANYVLVAADAGTTVAMDAAGATTITVNTGLFAAGDTVFIQNLGAGACTVTAGTATVATAGSLILPQNDAGILYFTSASAAIFYDYIQVGATSPLTTKGDLYTFGTSDTRLPVGTNGHTLVADSAEATGLKWAAPAGGGKVLQVVSATTTTATTIAVASMTDTTITATITPTLATSKILVLVSANAKVSRSAVDAAGGAILLRGATTILDYFPSSSPRFTKIEVGGATSVDAQTQHSISILDAPNTTSATTYKLQALTEKTASSGQIVFQANSSPSTITLMEIGV